MAATTHRPSIEWIEHYGVYDSIALHDHDGIHSTPIKRATVWPPFPCVAQLEIYYCLHADAGRLAEVMGLQEDDCYSLAGVGPIIILHGYKPFDTNLNPPLSAALEWNRKWRDGQLGREQAERQHKEKVRRQAEADAAANPVRNMVAEAREEAARINRVVENHPTTRVKRLEQQLEQLQRENEKLRQRP